MVFGVGRGVCGWCKAIWMVHGHREVVVRPAPFIRLRFSTGLYSDMSSALPLRRTKNKSNRSQGKGFEDIKRVKAVGGKGGDGCLSFLQLWANESAGPDGGDGGNGGHVIIQASRDSWDLSRVKSVISAQDGEKGGNKDCHGKSAPHTIIQVPVGTIVKDDEGRLVGDLDIEGTMFVLAKGGAGGHGNHFFVSSTRQSPTVAEVGANGEQLSYTLELRSIAHFGLVGFPNAGKSTILQAISRARPRVAPYPFTTLKPHLGIIPYSDYTHISVADLPGIIEDSHRNRGLGLEFLRHIERCCVLILVVDLSHSDWSHHISTLRREISLYSSDMASKPQLIVANKVDLPSAQENLTELKEVLEGEQCVEISAKYGVNLSALLLKLKQLYDRHLNDQPG